MNNMRVKQILQQFFIAVVVFSLFGPGNLWAKRKGAQLQIMKSDQEVIEGELLRVKEDSLLVMTSGSGTGVTVDIKEITKIRIKRKSKFGKGVFKGFLIGGGLGATLALTSRGNSKGEREGHYNINLDGSGSGIATLGALSLAAVGSVCGGIGGLLSGNYKNLQVNGKSPNEIKKIMKKLNKKARFKN
jgi:hypothetical protein